MLQTRNLFKPGYFDCFGKFQEVSKDHNLSRIVLDVVKNAQLSTLRVTDIEPTSFGWTRTREPGSVLGNLDPYLGTWTRTWEPGPK